MAIQHMGTCTHRRTYTLLLGLESIWSYISASPPKYVNRRPTTKPPRPLLSRLIHSNCRLPHHTAVTKKRQSPTLSPPTPQIEVARSNLGGRSPTSGQMPKTQYRIERYSDLRPNPPPRAKVTEGPPRLPSSKLRQGSQCHATVTTVWTIISFDLDTERPLHSKLNQPLQRTNFSVARMHSHAKKSLRLLNLDGNLDRSRSVYTRRAARVDQRLDCPRYPGVYSRAFGFRH